MNLRVFLITVLLVSWGQPQVAEAGRAPTSRVAKPAKVRTARVTRAKANARAVARPRRVGQGRLARLGQRLATSMRLRSAVKGQALRTKTALREGRLAKAAAEISRVPLRNTKGQFVKGPSKLSIREKFALWRARRAVTKASVSQAKERSRKGDLQGTASALEALELLGAKGQLGVFARWKVARAKNRVFKNVRRVASESLRNGDVQSAGQAYWFASQLKPGSRQAKSMGRALVKESISLAKAYAKAGQAQLTWSVLEMGASIASESGAKFSEKAAQKIVNQALVRAVPVLIDSAASAYAKGDVGQAVSLLAESRAIQRGGGGTPGFFARRKQTKLVQKLGDQLRAFEARQAQ